MSGDIFYSPDSPQNGIMIHSSLRLEYVCMRVLICG